MTKRVAIVGGGVSGLVASYLLHPAHDVTLFEAGPAVGGHVHTVTIEEDDDTTWRVDTGFIVYNEQNYPNFTKILDQLGVATQPSSMSFSVRDPKIDFEYNGSGFNQLFAQRSNLFRPSFYKTLREILRFNRTATSWVTQNEADDSTVGEIARKWKHSDDFITRYLVPLGSALWSTPPGSVLSMPARFFVHFLDNHGMLTVNDRPQWRVIAGGSETYVRAMTARFADRIRTDTPVHSVARNGNSVSVNETTFDHVIFACHSDQALRVLADPTAAEQEILGAIKFQANHITLHTDESVLPRRRRGWAAWNFHQTSDSEAPVGVTYNMNILQSLSASRQFCVTLNDSTGAIDESKILYQTTFSHPQYTLETMRAQRRFGEISGVRNTHYCGAYWGNGFHEDGVVSALRVCSSFGVTL